MGCGCGVAAGLFILGGCVRVLTSGRADLGGESYALWIAFLLAGAIAALVFWVTNMRAEVRRAREELARAAQHEVLRSTSAEQQQDSSSESGA